MAPPPQGPNFTLDRPVSRSHVPATSSARAGPVATTNEDMTAETIAAANAAPRTTRRIIRRLLHIRGGWRKMPAVCVSNTYDGFHIRRATADKDGHFALSAAP